MPHSSHYGSLLIIVRMKVVQEGEADFLIKNVSILKYGLHFSTVISRRDPLCGRCHRRYYFFLTYASKARKYLAKRIDISICGSFRLHNGNLFIIVQAER